jgi:hypothetical protein
MGSMTSIRASFGRVGRNLRIVSAVCLSAACGTSEEEEQAVNLLEQVREQGYRTWQRAPGWEARLPSDAPHGNEVDIYVNDVVSAALAGGEALEAWPLGSIIAKDGWSGQSLKLVALMEKRSAGWFWAEFDEHDEALYAGTPALCTSCHELGSDYVRAFSLPSP